MPRHAQRRGKVDSPAWESVIEEGPEVAADDDNLAEPLASPPSFAQSEFETIVRRQRNTPNGLKMVPNLPPRYPNLDNNWEFCGWGSMRYVHLAEVDMADAALVMSTKPVLLDQFRASSIAGNGVTGSVFYAFPAVAAAAGVFSPIALAVACIILFLYQPILLELGSAVRINGGNYTYLLQFSGKTLGLIGAAASLLDAVATSAVSSATAAAYFHGEFDSRLPLSMPVLSIILLVVFCLVALFKVKESSWVTLSFTICHLASMSILIGFGIAAWAKTGSSILIENWKTRPTSAGSISRAVYDGICIGFLGLTGFECTPTYIEAIKENEYRSVLRNLLVSALLLNAPLMLLVYVHLPAEEILNGTNILSHLAEEVAGKWLRYLVVADAGVVLCGGILAGLFTACELLFTLSTSGVLPKFFTRTMPITGGLVFAAMFFLGGCILMYATSGFSLTIISNVFSVTFLVMMLLYAISNMMLKFNRDRLPRQHRASLLLVLSTAALTIAVLVGNIVLNPVVLGLFASYFLVVLLGFYIIKSQTSLGRIAIWLYDQIAFCRKYKCTRGLDALIIKVIRRNRRKPICVFVKNDDIYHLVDSVLYVQQNEPTARIVFIHAYQAIEDIPSELAPNVKILDEAFPSITLDLVFVQGNFNPVLVQATSKKMNIPRTQMFMSTPGWTHQYKLADYKGLRVIHR